MPNLSQGPLSPGTIVGLGNNGQPWTNIGNVALDDGSSFATNAIAISSSTDTIKATNFGFSLPTSATVLGVKFTYKAKGSAGQISENDINLVKNSSIQGQNKAINNISTILTQFTLGSSSDLWTLSFLYSDINASNFGVAADWFNNSGSITETISADAFRLTVYYSIPATKFFFMGGQDN